jgi:hypothetical protein
VTYRLNEWRNEQWTDALESLDSEDQSLWKMTKRVMRIPTSLPPLQMPGGLALSDSEKEEVLAIEDQTLWKMTRSVMRFPNPSPPCKYQED